MRKLFFVLLYFTLYFCLQNASADEQTPNKEISKDNFSLKNLFSNLSKFFGDFASFLVELFFAALKNKMSTSTTSSIGTTTRIQQSFAKFCAFKSISCNSSEKYRSFDGKCNNLLNPLYGSANTPFKRILSPAYDDGVNSPRTLGVSGKELPNTRLISLSISPPTQANTLENYITHLFAVFGQFVTHDIAGTSDPMNLNQIDCHCGTTDPNCFNLKWPENDPYINQPCLKIARSTGSYPDFDCSINIREQLNLLSSFIDGTVIYGMDSPRASDLRTFQGGLLRTSQGLPPTNEGITNRTFLPLSKNETCSTQRVNPFKCFHAGEYRTSENLGLVSVHTLFNREHNRIAIELAKINPVWDDEKIYQETRRINVAQLQHIFFNEWLPIISGNDTLRPLNTSKYYTGYNPNINPGLSNEFSTAAFRMGHTLIRQKLSRYDLNQTIYKSKTYSFQDSVFQSDMAYDNQYQGLNSILSGHVNDLCWKYGTYSFDLQNRLNQKIENNTLTAIDLLATNIYRGRDHGIPSYVNYVKKCLNINVQTFDDLSKIINSQQLSILKSLYENVNDIDLFVGGLSENKLSDRTVVGPTFDCIIMDQFADIKNGDRFYYENGPDVHPYPFSLDQLAEIKKVTIAGLICNNYDVSMIQINAFRNSISGDPKVYCSTLKNQINLSKWTF